MKLTCDSEIESQVLQFGANMRSARQGAGLSQVDLALAADLDRAAISFLERAARAPNLPTLVRVAHATGVAPAFLLRGVGYPDRASERQPSAGSADTGVADPAGAAPAASAGANTPDAGAVATFGRNLRSIRLGAKLSQESLAFSASLDRAAVSVLERGQRAPNLRTILKLARALEVSPEALLGGID
ncbi:MAG TPA: helix-turn-helix transcriptional regulator [Solirubrobacteraceae bacterium]|nr:helix-turn-helix transcriptional regulator [Solirubrobacteraceae bacterium]